MHGSYALMGPVGIPQMYGGGHCRADHLRHEDPFWASHRTCIRGQVYISDGASGQCLFAQNVPRNRQGARADLGTERCVQLSADAQLTCSKTQGWVRVEVCAGEEAECRCRRGPVCTCSPRRQEGHSLGIGLPLGHGRVQLSPLLPWC